MPLRLTRSGIAFNGALSDLDRLREEFERHHCIRIPGLVEPGLLALIQQHVHDSEFYERLHPGVGRELCLNHNKTVGLLHFITNNPDLFWIVRKLTGCGRIGCFAGRVYRMAPDHSHYDSWHSDAIEHRMVALSINLSTAVFTGGSLQIRDLRTNQEACNITNTGFGDGILFRISNLLQHRLTAVGGHTPKTTFAGWFKSEPEYPYVRARIDNPALPRVLGVDPEDLSKQNAKSIGV
jgi:hypothetical protein